MEKSLVDHIKKDMSFLYYCAFKHSLNTQDAEDVVQESIIKMHRYYKEEKFTRGWMGMVVSSVALDKIRINNKHAYQDIEDSELEEAMSFFNSKDYQEGLLEGLDAAIDTLEDDVQKRVLKEARKGTLITDIKLEDVTSWKVKDSFRKGVKEIRKVSNKIFEIYS
tara:strand:+ start:1828 stop:2322 length:495 start_codon:yes stop_codon:yes gene_type:complete